MAQPSPMERQFLNLMDRIEQDQAKRIMQLEARILALDTTSQKSSLKTASALKRLEELEALLHRQAIALDSLNSTLAKFLAPPAWGPSLPASPCS